MKLCCTNLKYCHRRFLEHCTKPYNGWFPSYGLKAYVSPKRGESMLADTLFCRYLDSLYYLFRGHNFYLFPLLCCKLHREAAVLLQIQYTRERSEPFSELDVNSVGHL
jgi:hypothetical protein